MDPRTIFWVLAVTIALYVLLKLLRNSFGIYLRLVRKKYFIRSYGIDPLPRTPEKIEIVEQRLTELLDNWRPWLSQYCTLKAHGVYNQEFLEVQKQNGYHRDKVWQALSSAALYNYYCTIPFFDQFLRLIERNNRANQN